MLALAVALGVVAFVALVVVVVSRRALAAERRRVAWLEDQLEQRRVEVEEQTARAERAEAANVDAEARARAQADRAVAAERAAAQTELRERERAAELEASRAEAAATAEDLTRLRDALARAERELPVEALWALAQRRAERLWRDRLALPDEPLPRDDEQGPLAGAVRTHTEASREETGVALDLSWELDALDGPELPLAVLTVAEELVAAARASDGGELVVGRRPSGEVELRLRTEPAVQLAEALVDDLQALGWIVTHDDGQVLVAERSPDDGTPAAMADAERPVDGAADDPTPDPADAVPSTARR